MNRRYAIIAAAFAALLLVVTAVKVQHAPWTTPSARAVEQRGPLSEAERATIDIFERVSPSVVQVAVRSAATPVMGEEGQGGASGTGFVWDRDGHLVTNNHVVANGGEIAVRFASGEVARVDLIGTAPNYDRALLTRQSAARAGVTRNADVPRLGCIDRKIG